MPTFSFSRVLGQWLGAHHRAALVAVWALVQAGFLLRFHGPHIANDSYRYLAYAADIAECGYFEPGHNRRYILYPLFQSAWLWLGAGRWGIVAGQIAVSGLAARALYGAVRRLAGGRRGAAALATGLFVVWPDVQQFNAYLLTESLFISLSVLSFAALVRVRAGRGWGPWAALLALLTLTALARPNGFVVALAAALAGLDALRCQPDPRPLRAVLVALGLASPLLWQALNHQLATFYLMDTYQRGELIFRSPLWAVRSAAPLVFPPNGTGPVLRVLYFAAHNPGYFARLALGKLFAFVSGLKPYYSLAHRAANVLLLWPLYVLAGRGARRPDVWRPARVFLGAVPLLQAAVVMLTVEDYDVRFLAPVLPFVFALVALALWKSWGKVENPAARGAA